AAICDEAVVGEAVAVAADDGRARSEAGENRYEETNRGMQARELLVAGKRQLDREALLIRPPVALAREDPVECLVDGARRAMGPQLRVDRIEPGVHRRGHETKPFAPELVIREPDVGGELLGQAVVLALEVAAEFDRMQREPVVPANLAVLALGGRRWAGGEEVVRGRRGVEALAVDEHVLDRQAIAVEEAERRRARVSCRSRLARSRPSPTAGAAGSVARCEARRAAERVSSVFADRRSRRRKRLNRRSTRGRRRNVARCRLRRPVLWLYAWGKDPPCLTTVRIFRSGCAQRAAPPLDTPQRLGAVGSRNYRRLQKCVKPRNG